MAIDFPAGPSVGQTFTSGGITWTWDGVTWRTSSSGAGAGVSVETDPVFSISAAAGITTQNINNWNNAYNNHISLSSLSARTDTIPSGTGSLLYNNTSGVFTYVPPDLSGYLTSENDTLATVTSRGATTTSNVTVNDLTVNGNLTVQGNTIQLGTYSVSANEIVILDGYVGDPISDGFLRVDRGNSTDVSLRWNENTDRWQFTNDGTNYNNINSYTLGGSNNTSNQAILSITGTDFSTSSVEFGGAGGTTVSWDGLAGKVTIQSTAPVNADWNATGGLAQILNKPTIPDEFILRTATTTVLGGVKIDGTSITINQDGVISASPSGYVLPIASQSTLGGIKIGSGLTIDANGVVDVNVGGGNTLSSRAELSGTTGSLSENETTNLNITGYKAYSLFAIETSASAWVRVYTNSDSRSADENRSEGNDPGAGSGVIAEVRTFGQDKVQITPGVIGFNFDSTPTTDIYLAVTNRGSAGASITVTLTAVKLEV